MQCTKTKRNKSAEKSQFSNLLVNTKEFGYHPKQRMHNFYKLCPPTFLLDLIIPNLYWLNDLIYFLFFAGWLLMFQYRLHRPTTFLEPIVTRFVPMMLKVLSATPDSTSQVWEALASIHLFSSLARNVLTANLHPKLFLQFFSCPSTSFISCWYKR